MDSCLHGRGQSKLVLQKSPYCFYWPLFFIHFVYNYNGVFKITSKREEVTVRFEFAQTVGLLHKKCRRMLSANEITSC